MTLSLYKDVQIAYIAKDRGRHYNFLFRLNLKEVYID